MKHHDHGLQFDLAVMEAAHAGAASRFVLVACGRYGCACHGVWRGRQRWHEHHYDRVGAAAARRAAVRRQRSGGTTTTTGSCIADPEETNGPYPSDGSNTVNGMASNVLIQSGVVRSDIRSSFGSFDDCGAGCAAPL